MHFAVDCLQVTDFLYSCMRIVLFKRAKRIHLLFVGKAYRSGTATLESYLTHFDACLPFSSITIAKKVSFAEYLTSLSS